MRIRAFLDHNIPGACGVINLWYFTTTWNSVDVKDLQEEEGAGFLFVSFINSKNCKKVYEALSKSYSILFQSEVRKNTNSNNQMFICIFDLKKDKQ